MSSVVEASVARGGLDPTRPKLMAWLELIDARPACERALKSGGAHELVRYLPNGPDPIRVDARVTWTVAWRRVIAGWRPAGELPTGKDLFGQ